jgi:site-specific recombinase XerD
MKSKTKANTFLPTLSNYFETYLPDVKGVSENTIISYQYAFKLLFDFLEEEKGLLPQNVTFDSLSNDTLLEYLKWLETHRGCSSVTRNLRRAAISSFAKYALKNNFIDSLHFYTIIKEIPRKKTPKNNDIKYFSKEELEIILSLPNTKTTVGKRDVMLLSLLYASGARAQELCDITVNDVYFGDKTNIKLVGKGDKARVVTIPSNCAEMLRNWLQSRNLNPNNTKDRLRHIFSSQTNEHMSISCVEAIVKKYVIKAKREYPYLFKRNTYSPHSFRHSIAVHMLECGESLVVIKAFLGHESLSTTAVYASVTPELANKYLRERGQVLESADTGISATEKASVLSFLTKRRRNV